MWTWGFGCSRLPLLRLLFLFLLLLAPIGCREEEPEDFERLSQELSVGSNRQGTIQGGVLYPNGIDDRLRAGAASSSYVYTYLRFQLGQAIPANPKLAEATLRVTRGTSTGWTSSSQLTVQIEDTANAAAVASANDIPGRSRTALTQTVTWTPGTGASGATVSLNVAPLVTALANRYGGLAAGTQVQLFLRGRTTTTPLFRFRAAESQLNLTFGGSDDALPLTQMQLTAAQVEGILNAGTGAPPTYTSNSSAADIQACKDAKARMKSDPAGYGSDVNNFIRDCLPIKYETNLSVGEGSWFLYDSWAAEWKTELKSLYSKLAAGTANLGYTCPNASTMASTDSFSPRFYYKANLARTIYFAHIAHVLHLELAGKVPWSILGLSGSELMELFRFDRYFSDIRVGAGINIYLPAGIVAGVDFQQNGSRGSGTEGGQPGALICDPRVGYRFLSGADSATSENLIASTPLLTLHNIAWWFQRDVGHGAPEDTSRATALQWSYLSQRLTKRTAGMVIAAAGCQSAAGIFYDLARSVNIPTLMTGMVQFDYRTAARDFGDGTYSYLPHRGLLYNWTQAWQDAFALLHVDDLYANQIQPIFPIHSDGRPATEAEKKRAFFRVNWYSAAYIDSFNFTQVFPASRVTADDGYWTNPYYKNMENLPHLGDIAAYGRSATTNSGLVEMNHKLYELCGGILVETYCRVQGDRATFVSPSYFGAYYSNSSYQETDLLTIDQYFDRAQTCVNAYGGCAAVNSALTAWENSRGTNTYVARGGLTPGK